MNINKVYVKSWEENVKELISFHKKGLKLKLSFINDEIKIIEYWEKELERLTNTQPQEALHTQVNPIPHEEK